MLKTKEGCCDSKKVEKHWGKEGVIQIIHDTFLLNLKTPSTVYYLVTLAKNLQKQFILGFSLKLANDTVSP